MRDTEHPADTLYLLSHNPYGRPLVGPHVLGIGLAAGLLGELMTLDMVGIEGGVVHPYPWTPCLRRRLHRNAWAMARCGESYQPVSGGPECPRCRVFTRGQMTCPLCGSRSVSAIPCPRCDYTGIEEAPEKLQRKFWEMLCTEEVPLTVVDWLTVASPDAAEGVAGRLERTGWLVRESYRPVVGRRRERWTPENSAAAEMPRQSLRRIAEGINPPDDHRRFVAGIADAMGLSKKILADLPGNSGKNLAEHSRGLGEAMRYLVAQTRAANRMRHRPPSAAGRLRIRETL